MKQFDVCNNPSRNPGPTPYVIILQSDLLDELRTCVVAPLRHVEGSGLRETRFTPFINVQEQAFVLLVADLASIPVRLLTYVDTAAPEREKIIGALDVLFTGV